MLIFWEIVKLCVPTFLAVGGMYMLFTKYLSSQYKLNVLQYQREQGSRTEPFRLQAYERLSLYCERIQIENLLFRLHVPGASAGEMKAAMLITIQQEYEHNISQQLYVSESLWHIIKTSRDLTRGMVMEAGSNIPSNASNTDLEQVLLKNLSEIDSTPTDVALRAIRTEASAFWS
jgi:hypothetical protein